MSTTFEPFGYQFPSIEILLRKVLEPRTSVHVATETPPEFDQGDSALHSLPLIVVEKIAGADYDPLIDRPLVDIDCYATDQVTAQNLAEAVRYVIRKELPGQRVDNAVFTASRTNVGPRMVTHANRNVRRYTATYELSLHVQG